MAKTIKTRAKVKGETTTVKCLITHPMDPARKDKKTGKDIPSHVIETVDVSTGGKSVLSAFWGGGISKNPYLSFKFKGAKKGDELTVSWKDNKGNTDSATAKIK